MEKAQPESYYGPPSAPEANFQQGGYPPPHSGYAQSGLPPPDGLHQQGGYQSQPGYPNPPVYQQHQPGYPYQPGYQQQPGYGPQPGHQQQPSYPPQQVYHLQPGLPDQPGFPTQSGAPEPPYEIKKYGWWEDSQRNKPQSNSLAAATLIFISGGMSLAQSVGYTPILHYSSQSSYTHMQVCWFVAVIIGAIVSTLLVQKITKRVFNLISGGFILLSGILFISASDSVAAIAIGRYCDGIAFGLTLIPAIVAGSEESVKQFRGMVLTTEQIGLSTGFMIRIIFSEFWGDVWSVDQNQMHGILALIYGTIAIVLAFAFTIESPVFYLNKDNETEALNSLRRLQRPQTCTAETYALLYENKRLLEEDNARGRAENVSTGLVPMIKLGIFRAIVSMSLALPLTWALLIASEANSDIGSPYVYPIMRVIGVTIAIFTLDRVGRKAITGGALIIGGGLLIAVGALYSDFLWSSYWFDDFDTIITLVLVYQITAGLTAPASTCYLGEAFSVSVKPYFILIAVIVENVVQIIICCAFANTLDSIANFAYVVGVIQIVLGVSFFFVMPETKQTTLREALARFKMVLYFKF